MIKNPPVNAGLISGLGRSPGGGNGNPNQYSCLENPMDTSPWGRKESDTIEHTHSERYTGVLRVLGSKLAALGLVK